MRKPWYRRHVPKGVLYRRGKIWWYSLFLPDGERLQESLRTTKQFEAGIEARKLYERHYVHEFPLSVRRVLRQFRKYELERGNSPEHLQMKMTILERFFEWEEINKVDDITTAKIDDYLSRRHADGCNAKTRRNDRGCISRFCSWLVAQNQLSYNPTSMAQLPRIGKTRIVHLSRKEFDEAVKFATERKMWPIVVAAYTGLRVGELAQLKWSDIQETSDGPIIVVDGKTGVHAIPMHPKLKEVFKKIRRTGETVFPPKSRGWWWDYIQPLKKHIKTMDRPGGGWHDFRRTLGSLLVQDGVRIEEVSKLLRHNVTTTDKYYAHLTAEHGRKALGRL